MANLGSRRRARRLRLPAPVWKQQLNRVALLAASTHRSRATVWPAGREIIYLLDARKSRDVNMVVVTIARRDGEAAEGRGNHTRPYSIDADVIASLPLEEDRELLATLIGGTRVSRQWLSRTERMGQAYLFSSAGGGANALAQNRAHRTVLSGHGQKG